MRNHITGIALMLVVATGCSGSPATPSPPNPSPEQRASQPLDSQAKTPATATAKAPQARDIVETVVSVPALPKPLATLRDLAAWPETTAVVQGKVVRTSDFCWQGRGNRMLVIAPTATYKGASSSEVTVVEPGGIVEHNCLAEVLDGKFGEPFIPQPGKFVEFRIEGHTPTTVGAEVIAFVAPWTDAKGGARHRLITGTQGLFVRDGNSYVRSILNKPQYTRSGVEVSIRVEDAPEALRTAVG